MPLLQDERPASDELISINAEKIMDINKTFHCIPHEQVPYYEKIVYFPLAEHRENTE